VQGAQADGWSWLDRARQALDAARLVAAAAPDSSIILAYDAARQACVALLAQQGLSSSGLSYTDIRYPPGPGDVRQPVRPASGHGVQRECRKRPVPFGHQEQEAGRLGRPRDPGRVRRGGRPGPGHGGRGDRALLQDPGAEPGRAETGAGARRSSHKTSPVSAASGVACSGASATCRSRQPGRRDRVHEHRRGVHSRRPSLTAAPPSATSSP
jgi:hypothetical protein